MPTKKNPRNKKMKNPERLAASKKKPRVPIYLQGHIVYVREGTDIEQNKEEAIVPASVATQESDASAVSQETEDSDVPEESS